MKKNNRISPVGLKGQEINERMRELMGIKPINENQSKVVVELTKMGPDGNAYAIIRENHEWYIKKSTKTSNLVAEDFKYIGGLMNKKDEAYNSYAKAIKHLNLKFKNLAEAYNFEGEINVFENDNLLTENMPMAGGFSEMKSNGFSGHGNLENNKPMEETWMEEGKAKNPWAICTASVGRNSDKYESCVMDVKKKMGMDESMTEEGWAEECWMRENMTDEERAIDEMMASEELKGNQSKLDMNKNGKLDGDDFKMLRAGKKGMEEGEGQPAPEPKRPPMPPAPEPKRPPMPPAQKPKVPPMPPAQKPKVPPMPPAQKPKVPPMPPAQKPKVPPMPPAQKPKLSISEGIKNIDQLIDNFTEGLKKKV